MQATVASLKPQLSIRAVLLLFALLAVFLLGGVGGYMVKGQATQVVQAASACPAGSHAVVWYTAHTWGCVSN